MQENLVIVESPAKAKTIEKFLGSDYIVKSSFGHIRDLSKKTSESTSTKGSSPSTRFRETRRRSSMNSPNSRRRKPYGSHPMKTAKERPSHGT